MSEESSVDRFAKRAGIILQGIDTLSARADWNGGPGAAHYMVTLGLLSTQTLLQVEYSKGSAHRHYIAPPGRWPENHPFHGKGPGDPVGFFLRPRTVAEKEVFDRCTAPTRPTLTEVLFCLAADVRSLEYEDLDDVLSGLSVSRAIRAYRSIQDYRDALRPALTDSEWSEFLALDEDEDEDEDEKGKETC